MSGVAVVGEAASGNAYGSAVGTASGNNSSESAAGGMGGGGAVVASLSEMPTHFQVLQPPQKYYVSEQEVKDAAVAILKPYGIDRFVIGHSSRSNNNPTTKENFPRKRFHLLCGCCNNTIKDMDSATHGCCGFKLRLLLVENEYDEPHLEIREFCFPATSRHRLVSAEARAASESKVVVNEDMLTPTKESLLKNLGKVRARSNLVKSVFAGQFDGMQLEKNLMHRMMRKGRDEAFGATDSESMIMFYGGGIKLREVDDEYKVGGKFGVRTCASSGELVAWFEQHPVERLNAKFYAKDAVYVDTTHNATKFGLKTGPPSVVDWGGLTAPVGLFQVPEEETDVTADMMVQLGLNVPDATCCSDGGSAWPCIAELFRQRHVEDTFHNDQNGIKKAPPVTDKSGESLTR